MKAQILKTLSSNGKQLLVGDIVDVSEWRNAKGLVDMRYIRFIEEETVKPKAVKEVVK